MHIGFHLGRGIVLVAAWTCTSCDDGLEVRERPGEPAVYQVNDEDAAMNAAIAEARRTIPEFKQRLTAPPVTQSYISLKVRYVDGANVEHIWVDQLTELGGTIRGRIANEPIDVRNVTLGQEIEVPMDRVSDWMAIDDGRLIGGYTLRAIRDRMSPEERAEFDARLDYLIE